MRSGKTPYYMPMSQFKVIAQKQKDYLKSVDKKYGTQLSVQTIKKAGDSK